MNRNDRTVLLAAIILATLSLIGIYFLGSERKTQPIPADAPTRNLSPLIPHPSSISPHPSSISHHPSSLTPFDPNTADSAQLLQLGLQPWQIRNLYRYRQKGGIFRKKEDFARLYGLTVKEYRRLEPYIRISDDYLPASTLFKKHKSNLPPSAVSPQPSSLTPHPPKLSIVNYQLSIKKLRLGSHIALNLADTTALQTVPGIGPYFAKQIVRHGQWLGGYVSVDQLDEIDNFPQEAKKYFVITDPQPTKLNINRLTLQQLRRHPYINYYQAKAILDYRRLHGDIHSLQDLRFSSAFTDTDLQRLEPYIAY